MTIVSTVEFRNNLKQILHKSLSGEKVILKYYDKEFILKPTVSTSEQTQKRKKKKLSAQASKIIADIKSREHKDISAKARSLYPQVYNMTPQEEKEFIRDEKLKKYGL